MAKPIRLHPAAEQEAIQAREWYEEVGSQVADAFLKSLREAFDAISRNPEANPRHPDDRRYYMRILKKYPYFVVYESLANETLVLAVCHNKRRPCYWKDRSN